MAVGLWTTAWCSSLRRVSHQKDFHRGLFSSRYSPSHSPVYNGYWKGCGELIAQASACMMRKSVLSTPAPPHLDPLVILSTCWMDSKDSFVPTHPVTPQVSRLVQDQQLLGRYLTTVFGIYHFILGSSSPSSGADTHLEHLPCILSFLEPIYRDWFTSSISWYFCSTAGKELEL